VESILNQTYRDFEFIIVCDDPAYDAGLEYIAKVAEGDSRVIMIRNESNIGPTRSFNKAIAIAQGKYIARMDADDIAFPQRFEKQVAFLDAHSEISVCATDIHIIDMDGKTTRKNKYKNKGSQALNVIFNGMGHPSVMFGRSLLEERNPLYNEDYIYSQDYELWTYLILKGHKFHTINEPLLFYRKSESQISHAKNEIQNRLFKKAHREFIINWLLDRGIITPKDSADLKVMLNKASQALTDTSKDDKDWEYLRNIVYVLYFSIGTYSWAWRFRYLFDRNMIAFRIPFIYTFRLFVSSRTRKNRTGFN
jgi:glycosyltransferase involved in cell wall biosynthesis